MASMEERVRTLEFNQVSILKDLNGNGIPGIKGKVDTLYTSFKKKKHTFQMAGIFVGLLVNSGLLVALIVK
jgi:hypothetical protein